MKTALHEEHTPNLFEKYLEKFNVEMCENWGGIIGLRQKHRNSYRYMYARISWATMEARMETGLKLGVDYLTETLLQTGHKWKKENQGLAEINEKGEITLK